MMALLRLFWSAVVAVAAAVAELASNPDEEIHGYDVIRRSHPKCRDDIVIGWWMIDRVNTVAVRPLHRGFV